MASEPNERVFTAYARCPDGTTRALPDVDAAIAAAATDGVVVWADFQNPDPESLQKLGTALKLDPEALEDCLAGEQRPRVDEFDGHIFLVVYGMLARPSVDDFEPRKLAMFCGPRFLVTVHREPIMTMAEVCRRGERHAAVMLARGVDFFLYSIIDAVVDKYTAAARCYEDRIDELEEATLSPDVDDSVLEELFGLRRDLLEVRRVAASQKEMITCLARGEYDYVLSEALERRFNHVRDHLTEVVDLVDSMRDLLNGIRDHYHTAVADRTNSAMKALTVFAALILPLSVVTGIYGMNLEYIWPPPDHPLSFWGVLAAMFVISGALLVYFRRKKWI